MTGPSSVPLRLITVDTEDTLRMELHGDLDHDTADVLLDQVTAQLTGRPGLTDLHLHCGGLGLIDSTGLSVLLMIRRRTAEAGARLHLDDRPAQLARVLEVTGTLDYLTAPCPAAPTRSEDTGSAIRVHQPEGSS
ncbi:STAS domain-containing protein [Kitasatospora sp. NPDC096147]|uniref:STAS domain-containing protein n=1 Tax=Kitasatospora sp. NPDC096147 TaxID=3364093 RepID=UPI003802F812